MSKYKIILMILSLLALSSLSYFIKVEFFSSSNSSATFQQPSNQEEESKKSKEEWKKLMGHGDTNTHDGENILKDRF